MRDIVRDYIEQTIPRRSFVKRMSQAGFGVTAVASVLKSLEPFVQAQSAQAGDAPAELLTPFEGNAGEVLAEQLRAAGIKFLFLGNGSGLGPLCDALVDRPDMQPILATHEGHCVAMADGYAKASGNPGFVMISRVGSPNATSNMYNAMKDRSPIIVTSDHSETDRAGRDGHEDVEDWLETVEQFTKFRWLVSEPDRIPEWTTKALKLATTMPGGPVYLRFPRDVLYTSNMRAGIYPSRTFSVPTTLQPHPQDVDEAARMLLEAESPLLYVGPEVTASGAGASVVELAELLAIPVTQARSWAADFPTKHPLFLEVSGGRFPESIDVYLNLGAHMSGAASLENDRLRNAKIIHGRVETDHIGTAYPVHVPLAGSVNETATALVESIRSLATNERLERIRQPRQEATAEFTQRMRESFEFVAQRRFDEVPLTFECVGYEVNAALDRDAYIVEEFGTQGPKALRWFNFAEEEKTKIGRTIGYALGWGVAASVGVKLARPDNQVVCLQGDGGFLFGQIEALWSMSRYDVPVIVVIFNNRSYNETRARMFSRGGRQAEVGKDMLSYLGDPNVDFVRVAEAFGIRGEQVQSREQVREAMSRAIRTTREGRPYLIDARIENSGSGAEQAGSYPAYSVAAARTRLV